jgi:hypothetical protein
VGGHRCARMRDGRQAGMCLLHTPCSSCTCRTRRHHLRTCRCLPQCSTAMARGFRTCRPACVQQRP